jgi:3-hydroxyacyl-[acyl-carrier-protein] dehydratase
MRWYWIDRFVEFESGRYAKALKNISLAEDYLHDHFPGYPVMPASLIIEGMAQTGGLLVSEVNHFAEKVVLAKVASVKFHCEAVPGDTLTYTATIQSINKDGAMVTATSHKDQQLHVEMEVMFAHLDGEFEGKTLFDRKTFLQMMRTLGLFEVGRTTDGNAIAEPAWMLETTASRGQ